MTIERYKMEFLDATPTMLDVQVFSKTLSQKSRSLSAKCVCMSQSISQVHQNMVSYKIITSR